jgi:hypothetical protein
MDATEVLARIGKQHLKQEPEISLRICQKKKTMPLRDSKKKILSFQKVGDWCGITAGSDKQPQAKSQRLLTVLHRTQ